MCGIVAYIGRKNNIKSIVEMLKKLEYRGYDSSGIAYVNKGKISAIKKVGQIDNLLKNLPNVSSKIIISHTRWATHGVVNETNAHPQISFSKNFAVVHNGIIENYKQLKRVVGEDKFCSQTDTEVVVNIMETLKGSTLERFTNTCEKLKGSFSLALTDKAGKYLYIAKNKSPLYVSKTLEGYLVASDISCFNNDYYILPNGVIGKLSKDEVVFYKNGEQIEIPLTKMTYNFTNNDLQNYSHYMQKEIDETTLTIDNICSVYESHFNDIPQNMFENVNKIVLIGCGTAYHACKLGARWFEKNYKLPSSAHIASEFRYDNPLIDDKTAVFLVSQSGETADTLAVGELAKECGCKVYAITNVGYSTITKLADKTFPLCAGTEIGVASTKAYSAMLAVLFILANHNSEFNVLKENLLNLKDKINILMDSELIDIVAGSKRVFFIGRGDDGVTAHEGALKLKEIAYLDACGYYAGELKHGTIALVEKNVVVVAVITSSKLKYKTLNAVEEVSSRGATVIVITDDNSLTGNFKKILIEKVETDELKSILSVVPLQKLAYEVACKLGNNPDKPRNLAKSVTVE